jgi:3',5'-cyclic AMP phosphodiesterase CpdA
MLIAQLTDPHVSLPGVLAGGLVDTHAAFARAVAHVGALDPRPDVVLLTGDLVYSERAEEYAALRALLAPLPMPVYVIPGNHDDRALLRAAFADHAYLPRAGALPHDFLHYTVEDWPLRLIGLDTLEPGQIRGLLCPERLDWLTARLAEAPERPTLLFMHHPPFLTGLPADRRGFPGAEALGALLERHRQVVRIVSGHLHRPVDALWHGVPASVCPATAYQMALDLDGPRTRIALEPPALQLHLWREGLGLVTHTCLIGDYPVHELPKAAVDHSAAD